MSVKSRANAGILHSYLLRFRKLSEATLAVASGLATSLQAALLRPIPWLLATFYAE